MTSQFPLLSEDLIPPDAVLCVWVVYARPKDFPNVAYVARPQFVMTDHTIVPCRMAWLNDELDPIRDALAKAGLTCLSRMKDDDPKIVETWL
jgi:hypothetical protein